MLLINEEEVLKERIPRTCRRFIRNSGWFENVSQYSNERFKKCFKLSRKTFNIILEKLRPHLEKQMITEQQKS